MIEGERVERFWAKVDRRGPDDCWVWTAATDTTGYGRFNIGGGTIRPAHVVAYTLTVGPIPDGYDLDHQCHNADTSCAGGSSCPHRRCVNPAHLEPATRAVNLKRGRRGKAKRLFACRRGHPYTDESTYVGKDGKRTCRRCGAERAYAKRHGLRFDPAFPRCEDAA